MCARILLAALCALPLFSSQAQARTTYPTLAEARAARPAAHPGYRRLADGSRCWYVGRRPSKAECERALGRPPASRKHLAGTMARGDFTDVAIEALCGNTCPWGMTVAVPYQEVSAMLWYWLPR